MSRRSSAGIAAAALLIATWLVETLVPTNYVVYSPGPTVNLLAKEKGGDLIRVSGAKAYRDKGALRLLTVVPTGPDDRVYLAEAMFAWLNPKQAVYRESDIYQPQENADRVEAESAVDMVNSQDSAIASALHELGYKFGTSVQILGVTRGGPGDGALEVHDKILAVDGARTPTLKAVVTRIRKVAPGDKVTLRILRRNKKETVKVKTVASEDDPKSSALQVTVGRGYEFPVQVSLKISSLIGGPSAGTMFALAIYDTLTPGSLTGGGDVAGTGEIDGQGHVGGIGGIQQKLAAAQSAGATLFLAPASNCDEVKGGPYDPDKMRVVKISTLNGAIKAVKAWRKNPDAKLPQC
jgi:PDZ domain-containing protein